MNAFSKIATSNTGNLVSCRLPTRWGLFKLSAFTGQATGCEHSVLTMGALDDGAPILTRIHSECLTGDAFGSVRCDCGAQLDWAMRAIALTGQGALIYLRQEGRGIGLANKIRAYALQENGLDTVEANRSLGFPDDLREYSAAKSILSALGISRIRLMTNNPAKVDALTQMGIEVAERVPIDVGETIHNRHYKQTKARKMGHLIHTQSEPATP